MIILLVILVENSKFFCVLVCHFFENIIMTGEPTHTASEMVPHSPAISIII